MGMDEANPTKSTSPDDHLVIFSIFDPPSQGSLVYILLLLLFSSSLTCRLRG
ncbi:hypothetical protein BJY01DRAFT_215164 [Aspergillus pseudoustus]|uniref:Uncharacterized protein n=1 Tax=Aspergillus pseudoustus TaxID=1810923 RepID=A0ABR4JWA3_9EURO